MYKKILLSLVLVGSILVVPAAQAKGTPVIGTVVSIGENIINSIPVVNTVYNAVVAPVAQMVGNVVNIVSGVGQCGVTFGLSCPVNQIAEQFTGLVSAGTCLGSFGTVCLETGSGINPTGPSTIQTIPSKPLNVQVSNKYEDGTYINHGFRVYWDAPSSLGGASSVSYKIYRGTSASSLSTVITTTEMNNGQRFFLENRIQDPTKPFYYKVVACNAAGCSDGDVVSAPTNVQYLTNAMTLTGAGFSKDTKVSLVNDGKSVDCTGFTVPDSRTLTGGVCNITDAPTGAWSVRIQNPDGKMSECKDCFKITLPEPVSPSVVISKNDLSDGKFNVASVAGENLYTGAMVQVTAKGNTFDCFSLSSFDYQNSKFIGGQCDISSFLKTLGFTSDSDIAKLSVQILNDANSIPVVPSGIPSFTCTSSSYTPDVKTICGTSQISQVSNCGVTRLVMPELVCSSGQVCTNGACVDSSSCTPTATTTACISRTCGGVDNGCGGTISCGTCSSGYVCNNLGNCEKAYQ